MAFRGTLLLCVSLCVLAVVHSFVDLVCQGQTVELGHPSMLNCIIKPKHKSITDVNIDTVVWKKMNADETKEKTVLLFSDNTSVNSDSRYVFAEPSWDNKNMNVSLRITSTKLEDEGEYTCDVMTDSGVTKAKTSLKVTVSFTAKYNEPTVNLTKEKDIPHVEKALVCRAQGGYPEGKLLWFDGDRKNWTKSADFKAKQMDDGLYELSSKLPLLASSTFFTYICVVTNFRGGKEHEIVFHPTNTAGNMGEDKLPDSSISKIVAPVVVIGSLIVGLLLLLVYRRRSNQVRRPSSTPFLDPGYQCTTQDLNYVAP